MCVTLSGFEALVYFDIYVLEQYILVILGHAWYILEGAVGQTEVSELRQSFADMR